MGANRPEMTRRSLKAPPLTILLVAAHAALWLSLARIFPLESEELLKSWSRSGTPADLVAMFAYSFIHRDGHHLVLDMVLLWSLAAMVETRGGTLKLALSYFSGAALLAGFYFIFLGQINPAALYSGLPGALGPVACIAGAYTALFITNGKYRPVHLLYPFLPVRPSFKPLLLTILPVYFVVGFAGVFPYQASSTLFYWALLGGCLSVFVFGLLAGKTGPQHESNEFPAEEKSASSALYMELAKDPDDPLVMLRLARSELKEKKRNKGEKFYRKSIHELWRRGERAMAAVVFEEFFLHYGKVFCGPLQIQLSRELIRKQRYELAALALEAFIRSVETSPDLLKEPHLMPKAYVTLGKLFCDKLDRQDIARRVFYEFLVKYPFAEQRSMVVKKLKLVNRPAAA